MAKDAVDLRALFGREELGAGSDCAPQPREAAQSSFRSIHPELDAPRSGSLPVLASPELAGDGKKAGDWGAAFFSLDDWDKLGAGTVRSLLSAKGRPD